MSSVRPVHPAHPFHHRRLRLYPSSRRFLRILDKFVYVVAVLAPFMAFPQLVQIIVSESAAGVSIFTWGMYAFLNIFWILYAVVHHAKAVLICHSLWLAIDIPIVIAIFVYM